MRLGATPDSMSDVYKVYMGETIKSFRQLLKRYNLHTSVTLPFDSTNTKNLARVWLRQTSFPYLRGNVAGSVHETTDGEGYSYANTLFLHILVNCHSGWRGSMRCKVIPYDFGLNSVMEVTRDPVFPSGSNRYVQFDEHKFYSYTQNEMAWKSVKGATEVAPGDTSYPDPTLAVTAQREYGPLGKAIVVNQINGQSEFEIPFYSNNRFIPGKVENYTGTDTKNLGVPTFLTDFQAGFGGTGMGRARLDYYYAIGEDFTPLFWTGCPSLYLETSPPPPAYTV